MKCNIGTFQSTKNSLHFQFPMFCSPAAGMEVVVLKSQTVFCRLQLNARFGNGGKRSDLFLSKKGGYEIESKIRSKFIFQADFC